MSEYLSDGKRPIVANAMSRRRFTNKKKALAILAICIVVGGVSIALTEVIRNEQRSRQKIDIAKITALIEAGNCNKGLLAVSGEKPDLQNIVGSVYLLSYRSYCLGSIGKPGEAASTSKQLSAYLLKANKSQRVDIAVDISNIRQAQMHNNSQMTSGESEPAPIQQSDTAKEINL